LQPYEKTLKSLVFLSVRVLNEKLVDFLKRETYVHSFPPKSVSFAALVLVVKQRNADFVLAEAAMHWNDCITNYARETGFLNNLFVGPDSRVVGTWTMGATIGLSRRITAVTGPAICAE